MATQAVKRIEWPVSIPGATRFSDEGPAFRSSLTLVRQIRGLGHRTMSLLDSALVDHNHGQKRSPGHWPLAYLCFVISGEVCIEPWYRSVSADHAMWSALGFTDGIPAYPTIHQRFAELEQFADVFQDAAAGLIRLARAKDERIGAWIVSDGTECETHAQPVHDCGPDDACPTKGKRGPTLKRMSAKEASEGRQQGRVIAPEDVPVEEAPVSGTPIPKEGTREETEDGARFVSGGHWWRTRDRDAGNRCYKNKKVWFGHMHHKAVDLVTGAPLAVLVTSATENEFDVFPRLYEQAVSNTGVEAVAVAADKGLSISAVYEFLVRRGVTLVAPTREGSRISSPADGQQVSTHPCDRNGVPVCRGCGLPGDFVRFAIEDGKPRSFFNCPLPSTPRCHTRQSITCTKAPREILPIWRTSPIYTVLAHQVSVMEHVHEQWRSLYRSGGKSLRERLRRPGVAWQQLRASAALLVEWVWVLTRQGWIGRKRAERERPVPLSDGGRHARIINGRAKRFLLGGGYDSGKPPPGFELP